MNTRNIKTVIIILLAAANIFLIINISALNMRLNNIPDDMIEKAAAILKERGIDADVKKIPPKKPADYIYEGVYSDNDYTETVKYFTGASDEDIKNGHHMISASISAGTVTSGAAYNVGDYKFRFENYLQAEIIKSNCRQGDADEAARHINFSRGDESKARRIINDFLKKYQGSDIRTGFEITALKKDGGREEVLINQTADGISIASHGAYIIIEDGEVKYFSGRWYFGTFFAKHENPLLDSVNILFKCLEQDGFALAGAKLEKMEHEYTVKQHEKNKFYLAPSWAVSFEDGRKFSYDMITGNKNN